ncbi:MAG: anaerobic ribonucleoside-triphosphate reductase activating protein [Candidatus Micrarchaeaceae archaeon]
MIIGGLQKVSLIDYPGRVSAVVFTRGCNFRCRYCHNPALVLPERYCTPIPEGHVMSFLESRRKLLDGVVITGGEPTIQAGLPEFMRTVKGMGYLVKLDTSGVSPDVLEPIIKKGLVDYIAMDIKAPLEKYSTVTATNVDMEKLRRSISLIKGGGIDYEFRTTVASSLTSADDIASMAKSLSGAKRYILQRFVKSETLDPTFAAGDAYSDEEFEGMMRSARMYVDSCTIR